MTTRTPSQQMATKPDLSAWVTANAGAGKTLVLVDRVIRLLLAGTPPHRILCLTFTRNAAAEMANRLLDRLGQWALMSDEDLAAALTEIDPTPPDRLALAGARRLFASALETPGGLKIQTFHAFCEALLKRFPLEAGIPPYFQILDEREARACRREAFALTLAEANQNTDPDLSQACRYLSCFLAETRLESLIETLVTHRKFSPLHDQHWHQTIANILKMESYESVADILTFAYSDPACDRQTLGQIAEILQTNGTTTDIKRAKTIQTWLHYGATDRQGWAFNRYRRAFLKENGEALTSLATQQVIKTAPQNRIDIQTLLKAEQDRLLSIDQRLKPSRIAETSAALGIFTTRVLEYYRAEKRHRVALDFDDLIKATRSLLGKNHGVSWVMYKLDGGIDHILIDESQDTSPEQWAVITAFSDEFFSGMGARDQARSFFSVGDEKQSIYGFQGADPAFGMQVKTALASQVKDCGHLWKQIELGVNFRSNPAVLHVVDRVFEQDSWRQGVAETWIPHRANRAEATGWVEWWPLMAKEKSEATSAWQPPDDQPPPNPAKQLAETIAEKIATLLEQGDEIPTTGQPIKAGDILILLQKRAGIADDLTQALKRQGVPVAGNDRLVLSQHLAVMDLSATARFALDPQDDLTLATILKGPFCGLNEEDLMTLCFHRLDHRQSLWQSLNQKASETPSWHTVCETLKQWLKEADCVPPYDFFANRLAAERGRHTLLERLGKEAEEPIHEFLDLCLAYERTHPPSLQGYLHWFTQTAGEIKRETDTLQNAVRIMTVHGAKGLEAPVVFLADSARTRSAQTEILWAQFDPSQQVIPLWPGDKTTPQEPVCHTLAQAQQQENDREYRRLLYVAMTRARDYLYVCGWETKGAAEAETWHTGIKTVLQAIGTEIPVGENRIGYRYGTENTSQNTPHRVVKTEIRNPRPLEKSALPNWLHRPAPPESGEGKDNLAFRPSMALFDSQTKWERNRETGTRDTAKAKNPPLAPSRLDSETPPDKTKSPGPFEARQRGILSHHLLARLPGLSKSRRRPHARKISEKFASVLKKEDRHQIITRIMALLDHPDFREVFSASGLREVPLTGTIGHYRVTGQIDRLNVTDQTVSIIDYKSGSAPASFPEGILERDRLQLASYRALCQTIYPDKQVACALLWIEVPLLYPVPETILDDALSGLLKSSPRKKSKTLQKS